MLNASPIALIGCSIAAALALLKPTQTVNTMSEWQSLFDYFRTSSHDPRPQRLVVTVNAPVAVKVGVSSARWFLLTDR